MRCGLCSDLVFSSPLSPPSPKEANFGLLPFSSHQLATGSPPPRGEEGKVVKTVHSPSLLITGQAGPGQQGGQRVERNLKSIPGCGAVGRGSRSWKQCIFQRLVGGGGCLPALPPKKCPTRSFWRNPCPPPQPTPGAHKGGTWTFLSQQ